MFIIQIKNKIARRKKEGGRKVVAEEMRSSFKKRPPSYKREDLPFISSPYLFPFFIFARDQQIFPYLWSWIKHMLNVVGFVCGLSSWNLCHMFNSILGCPLWSLSHQILLLNVVESAPWWAFGPLWSCMHDLGPSTWNYSNEHGLGNF